MDNIIIIERVTNGVIVKVGCQTFVFEKISIACEEIGAYLRDPREAAKRWESEIKEWTKNNAPVEAIESQPIMTYPEVYTGGLIDRAVGGTVPPRSHMETPDGTRS